MANRFPITVNTSTNRLEELPTSDNIDLTGSGIYDGSSAGSVDQILTSTGNGIEWKDITQLNINYISAETDPVFTASVASGITSQQISNWNLSFGWGNHAQAGYLKSYTETDPVFTASAASGITSQNISNWNSAYGWGNHSTAGYLTSVGTINAHTDVDTTTSAPTNGQALVWNSALNIWQPGTVNTTASLSVTTNSAGSASLTYDSNTGVLTYTPPDLSGYLTSFSETDTLDSVASRGASTSVTLTLQDLLVAGNLTVQGTTTQNNVTSLNVTNNELVINDGQASPGLNGFIRVDRGSGSDTSIKWNEVTDRWQFTNDGTTFYNIPVNNSDLANGAGYITGIGSLSVNELSDVDTVSITPSNGQALLWDNANSVWKPGSVAASLTVKEVQGNGGTANLTVNNVSSILFDNLTGFNLTDNGNGEVYVELSSTFKTWYVAGQQTLVASGEDSIEIIAGTGISLSTTTSGTGSATKAITISATGGIVTETDPVFSASPAAAITNTNISNWNTSYNQRLELTDFSVTTSGTPSGAGSLTYNNQTGNFTFVPPNLNSYLTQESDTLSTVTARGATTTSNIEVNDLTVNGNLTVQGSTTQVGTYTVAANQIVILDGTSGSPSSNGFFKVDRGDSLDVSIKWNETLDKWQFTNDGTTFVDLNAYDLTGSNTTTNQAIISLDASDGTSDTIEFAGSQGTTVSWDGSAQKITIESTAPVNADWNATSGLAQILNKPTIPDAYSLPTASTSVLGGVKIDGTSITISDGIISAAPSGYNLPVASTNTLGGIKVGSGLTIDANGVLDVTSGAGTSLSSRQELSGTTSSLNDNETGELNITGYKAYSLFKIETSDAAWVRVYINDASRDNDINRSEGNDPGAGSGVIAEVRTFGAESVPITPGVIGFNLDNVPTTNIYVSVTNRSGSSQTITVTLTAIKLEV